MNIKSPKTLKEKLREIFNKEKIRTDIKTFIRGFQNSQPGIYAANTAFYTFTALIPQLMLVCTILPLTTLSEHDVIAFITSISPDIAGDLVESVVRTAYSSASGGVFIFSIIFSFWMSTLAMNSLTKGLNAIYNVKNTRNPAASFGVAFLSSLIFLGLMLLFIVFYSYGRYASSALKMIMPGVMESQPMIFVITYIIPALILFLIFSLFYTFLPSGKRSFIWQLPGAAFSAAACIIASLIFSLFTKSTTIYTTIYGGLASIILIMLYIFMLLFIIMTGAYVNVFVEERERRKKS